MKSLRRADHSSRWVLPTVVRRCVWSRNLVNEEALAHWGGCRAKNKTKKFPQNYDKIVSVPLRPNHSKEYTICNLYGWRFRSLSRMHQTLLSDMPDTWVCLLADCLGLWKCSQVCELRMAEQVAFYMWYSFHHDTALPIHRLHLEMWLPVISFHSKIHAQVAVMDPIQTNSSTKHTFFNSATLHFNYLRRSLL